MGKVNISCVSVHAGKSRIWGLHCRQVGVIKGIGSAKTVLCKWKADPPTGPINVTLSTANVDEPDHRHIIDVETTDTESAIFDIRDLNFGQLFEARIESLSTPFILYG